MKQEINIGYCPSEDWYYGEACKILGCGGFVRAVTFPPIFEETIKVVYPYISRTYYYESFDDIEYRLMRIEEDILKGQ